MAGPGRKTQPPVAFFDQAPFDRALVALATPQHSVFAVWQAVALGITGAGVRKRAAASRLHRIHQGVYSLVPTELLSRNGRWMAAVLACGPGAVLSHRSAAALHELRRTDRANIEVTVPRRSARSHDGIDVHRSTTLTAADLTAVQSIPCTSVGRTLFDLAEVVDRRGVERACDQAEILEVFDLAVLEDQVERNPTRRAGRVIRSVLAEHYIGGTPTWNELEEAFLALSRSLGLPDPLVNRWIDLGDGEPMIRGDFVWYEQRVIVETDGRRPHGTHQARERDPRRDQRALLAGWTPIRTTWRQVMRKRWELEPTLLALVGGRSPAARG
jgi:hypothetical protein